MAKNVRLVMGCHSCYFYRHRECLINRRSAYHAFVAKTTLNDCPLKENDITIKLVEK